MTAHASISTAPAFQNFSTARRLLLLVVLAVAAATGCAADTGLLDDDGEQVDVDASEQALIRGSGGTRLGYSCSGGTCTCDKSIENDCEDMSGVCSDASIDALIACINGWLTTHCTCTQVRSTSGAGSVYTPPTGGVVTTGTYTTNLQTVNKATFTLAK